MKQEKIRAVIQTIHDLFAEKSELKGIDDWDRLIGCIMTLQSVANELDGENNG